jgi:hypothetical protein
LKAHTQGNCCTAAKKLGALMLAFDALVRGRLTEVIDGAP